VILYDEPTAGLDPINTCLITRLILRLKTTSVTQVVVTHDLHTADSVADSLLMIQRGRIIFQGTAQELKQAQDPEVRFFIDPSSRFPHEQETVTLPRPTTPP
jgi:phospholipid/cholesterol/gamma-HCH transport system ATP-binding protein